MLGEPEDPREITFERGRDVLYGLEPRANRPTIPAGEESFHRRRLAVGPQGAEGFFDRPRATDFQIQGLECSERFLMAFGPALLAEQPQVLRASQRRVATIAKKRAVLLLPHRVDGFRHVPHDVESVEHNLGVAVGQALARRADVRLVDYGVTGEERRLDPPMSSVRPRIGQFDETGLWLEPGALLNVEAIEVSPPMGQIREAWARVTLTPMK